MSISMDWFKPTKIKLLFLIEWGLFIIIEIIRGKLKFGRSILVAGYPLIFFYLVACILANLSQRVQQITHRWVLTAYAGGLILLDQTLKFLVTIFIANNASVPVLENWLHVAHVRNYEGSWIAAAFDLPGGTAVKIAQWCIVIAILTLANRFHRSYVTQQRQSLWVDVALVGIVSAYASWICDITVRGYVVDFIALPGLVITDLKDIFVTIGAAAFLAEYFERQQRITHNQKPGVNQ